MSCDRLPRLVAVVAQFGHRSVFPDSFLYWPVRDSEQLGFRQVVATLEWPAKGNQHGPRPKGLPLRTRWRDRLPRSAPRPQFRDLLFRRASRSFYGFDVLWGENARSDDEQEMRRFRDGEDLVPLIDRELRRAGWKALFRNYNRHSMGRMSYLLGTSTSNRGGRRWPSLPPPSFVSTFPFTTC